MSAFKLDAFEITVGRMRAFFAAVKGNPRANAPADGAGKHPKIAGSGWRTSFNARLPGSWAEIDARLTTLCAVGGNNADWGAATWTSAPGPNEAKPVNCIDWYTLFAFCVWDGGRLPTDAEWGYVGVSGDEKRKYPYGNGAPTFTSLKDAIAGYLADPPDPTFMFTQGPLFRSATDGPLPIAPAGLKTERSKWGHADLTGNLIEYVLDSAVAISSTCSDCATIAWPDPPQTTTQPPDWQVNSGGEWSDTRAARDGKRLARGSSWQGVGGGHDLVEGKNRFWAPVWRTYSALGGRCARD